MTGSAEALPYERGQPFKREIIVEQAAGFLQRGLRLGGAWVYVELQRRRTQERV